jgi:hypothetical protein
MSEEYVIDVDSAKVAFPAPDGSDKIETRVLGWGDVFEIENPKKHITDTKVAICF